MREITDAEITERVTARALIDACAASLAALGRGEATQAAKQLLPAPDGGFYLSISAVVPTLGWALTKWATYRPSTAGPGVSTSTILGGPADGSAPTVLVTGLLATRLRTAASAVAVLEALSRMRSNPTVGLVGFGPTNGHVAAMLAAEHHVRDWRVLVRSSATGDRAGTALPGRVEVGTDPGVLAGADVVVSATGAATALAAVSALEPDAVVLCLDGRRTWEVSDAVELDDRSSKQSVGDVALLLAGRLPVPSGRVFIDQAGSAVTDAALLSIVAGGQAATA